MIGTARATLLALAACLTLLCPLAAQTPVLTEAAPASAARIEPVSASHGMVVAQEGRAARIGVEVLERGGNAVDAAVATGFALAVTYPRAGNIGGGGYMLIHLAERKLDTAIDYRETAPAATTREIFLDERGEADPHKSQDSALAIGVPGTVAGLALAHAKYGSGKFTFAELIAPAIALARDGIPIENDIADSLPRAQARLARWPATMKIFFTPDGRPLGPGATLVQRDLADTLAAIAREGPRAFYRGAIADKLATAIRSAGGIMTREDLERYQPVERTPTFGSYRGYRIVSMPPSSSGGVVLIEMLNILEGYKLDKVDAATRVHLMVEAMKRAYFDRAKFLGDPASVTPPPYLTSKRFAGELRERIDPARAAAAASFGSIFAPAREGDNTTHFSVVDRFGNAVANTTTLNLSYGVGLVAEGTGVLLNDELDDFAAKPGAPNAFGLVGGDANAPGPGKRPLSSMT
ncbi:MAG TPA: gamma-glutamyltransferase, partial [Burkholderiales bacterium]|nr:gamma-glutamyltransferase [Burkholderiales bacterium]